MDGSTGTINELVQFEPGGNQMKEIYLNSRPQLKTCKNCGYRYKGFMGIDCCGLSGWHCETERRNPTRCGAHYEHWRPRPRRRSLREWILDVLWRLG